MIILILIFCSIFPELFFLALEKVSLLRFQTPVLRIKIVLVLVNLIFMTPGGQVNFCNSHKITVVIWPVGFSKDLSTLDV